MIAGQELFIVCQNCSGHFKPHNRLQKYCDSNCRNKANYKKHKRISRGELLMWIEENREIGQVFEGCWVVSVQELLEFLDEEIINNNKEKKR